MHSQQMFTECIAQTTVSRVLLSFLQGRPPVDGVAPSHEREEAQVNGVAHIVICVVRFGWLRRLFNVLPSSGRAGGTAGHRSASSSEAPRRL